MVSDTIREASTVRCEVNALLDALDRSDYGRVAKAQARLKALGWYLGREAQKPRKPRQDAPRQGGDA
jgi:hypothetical protein